MSQTKEINVNARPESCWINYRLDLKGIRHEDVASKARCSASLVSKVISGVRSSKNVQAVLAEMLGYESWKHLWADAFISADRRAV